jgi:hypothetical protein
MKRNPTLFALGAFALGILTALQAQAQPAGGLALKTSVVDGITKVDWDDWHNRWRSHYRWGSRGEWGAGGGGWHNRWRSHWRWGSRGEWGGGGHYRWGSGNRWWR